MSQDDEIKSRHQRAGYLWKLPMSKCVLMQTSPADISASLSLGYLTPSPKILTLFRATSSTTWSKRFFVAKDGFLLYYSTGSPTQTFFDTKPKV